MAMLYATETVVLKKTNITRTEVAEIRMLQWMLGAT